MKRKAMLKIIVERYRQGMLTALQQSAECNVCGEGRVVYHRVYSGERLCRKFFVKTFEKRVARTIARYRLLRKDDRIAVAVSGGKDSLSLLHVLKKIESNFPKAELFAVTVDEGIEGYRDEALELVSQTAARLGVPLVKTSFEEVYGVTLSKIVASPLFKQSGLAACSVCGPLRRKAINMAAKRFGATVVATAHTLDDIVQTYLLKALRGELGNSEVGLRSEGPAIPRVAPFRLTPEREVVFYAYSVGIPFQTQICPNASNTMRSPVRRFLTEFEEKHPGSLFAALKSFERVSSQNVKSLRFCKHCGEPTSRETCRVCELIQTLTTA
ncbi:MAG: TIGR00269 family protein [Candidatus Caldarchaeum sp.]